MTTLVSNFIHNRVFYDFNKPSPISPIVTVESIVVFLLQLNIIITLLFY